MMTRDEVKNSIAVALGAPTIDPRLSDGVLTKILDMAANAPVATECGALESAVGTTTDDLSVDVFRKMVAQHAGVPCQMVFDEMDNGTIVIVAMTGNGPKARQAAQLYALAHDAIIALVMHARAQQREIDSLRAIIAPPTAFGDREDGGL